MTDRIAYLTVVLDRDMRDDDVQCVVDAIKMIKYVRTVKLGEPVSGMDEMNRERAKWELREKINDLLR